METSWAELSTQANPSSRKAQPATGSIPPPAGADATSGEAFVRLDSQSNVVASRGEAGELAALVAYAAQAARKIGAAFGENGFYALEWVTETSHGVMYVDEDDTLAALRARDEKPLSRTKSRFNL